jgi:hypothetical protein
MEPAEVAPVFGAVVVDPGDAMPVAPEPAPAVVPGAAADPAAPGAAPGAAACAHAPEPTRRAPAAAPTARSLIIEDPPRNASFKALTIRLLAIGFPELPLIRLGFSAALAEVAMQNMYCAASVPAKQAAN